MRAEDIMRDTEQRERTDRIIDAMEELLQRLERQTKRLEILVNEIGPAETQGETGASD